MLCVLDPNSSTSCSNDCRKLGAPGSTLGCLRGIGLASRDEGRGRELLVVDALCTEGVRTDTLGRLLFITGVGSLSGSCGDAVPGFLFLFRDEEGSLEDARACSNACHAMSSSAFSAGGSGDALGRRLRGVNWAPGLLGKAGSVSLKRLPAP